MRRIPVIPAVALWAGLWLAPMMGVQKPLQIYFIDAEGGQSTLVVDPQGESLLIDTGWDDFKGRDADRIMTAAKAAGIDHIDDLLLTHYHSDHAGGVAQIASRIKINTFLDHGANAETSAETTRNYETYENIAARGKHVILKSGDKIPFQGIDVKVVASAAETIASPLPGANQPNPRCASEPKPLVDPTENGHSVGILITYGKFRFIDLGDLTTQGELKLVCPNNLIGTVNLFLITHHGTAHPGTGDSSNSPAIVDALHPRVAIMNNSAIKGGHPLTWQTVRDSPGIEDIWQLHYAVLGGDDHNSPERFIANVGGNDDGNYIKVTAKPNATFTVVNSRNSYAKTYEQ